MPSFPPQAIVPFLVGGTTVDRYLACSRREFMYLDPCMYSPWPYYESVRILPHKGYTLGHNMWSVCG